MVFEDVRYGATFTLCEKGDRKDTLIKMTSPIHDRYDIYWNCFNLSSGRLDYVRTDHLVEVVDSPKTMKTARCPIATNLNGELTEDYDCMISLLIEDDEEFEWVRAHGKPEEFAPQTLEEGLDFGLYVYNDVTRIYDYFDSYKLESIYEALLAKEKRKYE